MKKLVNEFKEFITRGNVLDMAIGVIIATAFGKITTSLVNDLLMPFIGWICGSRDMTALNVVVRPAELDAAGEVLVPSWKDLETSRIDALVLTHGLFSRLRAGEITAETLLEKLDALRDGCAEDADEPFDAWPEGYVPGGDDETLHWLLNAAVERLEALLDR